MRRKTRLLMTLLLFALVAPFSPLGNVSARETGAARMLKVSPAIFQISLSPGKTTAYTIRVENLTDAAIAVRAEVEPLETTAADEGTEPADDNTPNNTLISFLTIPKPDLLIPAGTSVDVPFTVTIPREIPLGGYYATIYLTPLYRFEAAASPVVVPRIGIPVLGSVGVPENLPANRRARITASRILNPLTSRTELDMLLAVKNLSLHHFTAKPIIRVSTFGSSKTVVIPEKIVLPGKSRAWNEKIPLPGFGIYQITMAISLGGGDMVTTTAYAASLPGRAIAAVSIILFAAVLIVFRRKQLFSAIRILFRGK